MNKKAEGDKSVGTLTVRLKAGDRELFEAEANRQGKKVATWARDSLVALAKVDGAIARSIVLEAMERVPGILDPEPVRKVAPLEAGPGVPLDERGNIKAGHFTIPPKNMGAYT